FKVRTGKRCTLVVVRIEHITRGYIVSGKRDYVAGGTTGSYLQGRPRGNGTG
ncbi:hypothetical protein LCGC14_2612680, partial [marine sediment metagenome]